MYLSVECFIVISSHQGLLTNRNVLLCYTITILTLILFPVFITFMYRPGAGTHTHTHMTTCLDLKGVHGYIHTPTCLDLKGVN